MSINRVSWLCLTSFRSTVNQTNIAKSGRVSIHDYVLSYKSIVLNNATVSQAFSTRTYKNPNLRRPHLSQKVSSAKIIANTYSKSQVIFRHLGNSVLLNISDGTFHQNHKIHTSSQNSLGESRMQGFLGRILTTPMQLQHYNSTRDDIKEGMIEGVKQFYKFHSEKAPITDRPRLLFYRTQVLRNSGKIAQQWLDRWSCYDFKNNVLHHQEKNVLRAQAAMNKMMSTNWETWLPLHGQKWDIQVIDHDHVYNAQACMNGTIFLSKKYITDSNEDELAFVISHEMGHVVAAHMAESVSHQMLVRLFLTHAVLALGTMYPFKEQNSAAYEILTYYIEELLKLLPANTAIELEADRIGLQLMAKAGFDPNKAVEKLDRWATDSEPGPSGSFSDILPVEEALSAHAIHEIDPPPYPSWVDTFIDDAIGDIEIQHPPHEKRRDELMKHLDQANRMKDEALHGPRPAVKPLVLPPPSKSNRKRKHEYICPTLPDVPVLEKRKKR